jgi:hypothetical protein
MLLKIAATSLISATIACGGTVDGPQGSVVNPPEHNDPECPPTCGAVDGGPIGVDGSPFDGPIGVDATPFDGPIGVDAAPFDGPVGVVPEDSGPPGIIDSGVPIGVVPVDAGDQ